MAKKAAAVEIVKFYAGEQSVSTDVIDGGVEITEDQYHQALEGMALGKTITIDGGFSVIDPTPESVDEPDPTLEQSRSYYKVRIDADAEGSRGKYITLGAGQAMTYMQKAAEAKAYLAADMPDMSDYPLLLAEVGITAPTMSEVATVIATAFTQWQQIGAAIESVRLGTKAAIEAAETVDDVKAAAASAVWP